MDNYLKKEMFSQFFKRKQIEGKICQSVND